MEYLKKYNLTTEELKDLEETYNEGIIKFIKENELFVRETIDYLYSENITCIYKLMKENIKIFLETKIALKKKIKNMKEDGDTYKVITMKLLMDIS